jgi:hypothetical protein
MAEGYWLKGDKLIDVTDSSHLSALESNPRLFGLPLDLVSFAYKKCGLDANDCYECATSIAINSGWIRVRHNCGFGTDKWVFEFANHVQSKKAIKAFVEGMARRSVLTAEVDILLIGRNDGRFKVYHLKELEI